MTRSARRRRGQAAVEAALILPLLLTVVMIGVDFGRLYASQVTVNDAARQAARYGATNPGDAGVASSCGQWKGSVATAQNEAAGSPISIACPNVTLGEAGPDSYGANYVTASVKAPFSFVTPFLTPLLQIDHVTGTDTARESNANAGAGGGGGGGGGCNPSYSGRAWSLSTSGIKVGVLTSISDVILGDSGSVPPGGGTSYYGGALSVSIANLLSAQLQVSSTSASSCYVSGTEKVASVTVAPLGNDLVDLTLLTGSTAMPCGGTSVQSTSVASVKVSGVNVPVPAGTNQVVSVGGVTLTFNRQQPGANPPSVDAVSLSFPAGGPLSGTITGTITVGHAEARC